MYTCNSLIYLWYTLDFRALCNSNIKKRINIDVLHNFQIIIIVQWRRAKHCSSIVHMCSLSLTYYRMACTLINNLKEKKIDSRMDRKDIFKSTTEIFLSSKNLPPEVQKLCELLAKNNLKRLELYKNALHHLKYQRLK